MFKRMKENNQKRKEMFEKHNKNVWGNHSKECPDCGGSLKLKEFIMRGFSSTKSETTSALLGDLPHSEDLTNYVYVAYCVNCGYQKRTYEWFFWLGMLRE